MTSSLSLTIAIDASRTTAGRITGTENYARQLIHHLIVLNDQREEPHRLILYFRDQPPETLFRQSEHVEQRVVRVPRLWTHVGLALALTRDRPDVAFVPAHTLPFVFPGRAVVTVHDLGFKYFPEAHPRMQRLYLDMTTRYSARRATLILADSHATAADLTRFYGTPAEQIRVVYPGVIAPEAGAVRLVRQTYKLPQRYFLFIGTLQPRKNIARIVEAYQMWRDGNANTGIGLVLAGAKGWLFEDAWVEGVEGVHHIGYVPDEHKGPLLAGALALVFPSLYEGFGFPAVEAMHCGTPVIASTTSSLPELVGDAGILVNPLEAREIAAAMDLLVWREDLRFALRVKGYQQADYFTWRRAAEQVMAVLETAAT